ncbi:MAG: DUF1835 domain-containing protein [Rhodospirillaceae bacterium]
MSPQRLHITNGDAVASPLQMLFAGETVLPWRDMLHEGPLPPGLNVRETAAVRAPYLQSVLDNCPWLGSDVTSVARYDTERAGVLDSLAEGTYDRVLLWFEHDLYDQLQLLQILDHVHRTKLDIPIDLICIDHHPEVTPFYGLGQLSPAQLKALEPSGRRLFPDSFQTASRAWGDLRDPEPKAILPWLNPDLAPPALPFITAAIHRWCQEFPWVSDGLDRTERTLLQSIATMSQSEPVPFGKLFQDLQIREDAPFQGDLFALKACVTLSEGENPLLRRHESETPDRPWPRFALTVAGRQVLAGEADRIALCGITRVRGGIAFTTDYAPRWDDDAQQFFH